MAQSLANAVSARQLDNTSVNPARSTRLALIQTGWAVHQSWVFRLVPLLGGVVGGWICRALFDHD